MHITTLAAGRTVPIPQASFESRSCACSDARWEGAGSSPEHQREEPAATRYPPAVPESQPLNCQGAK